MKSASSLFRVAPTRLIDVGEGEMAVRSVGSGPDVLLVHGWPVSGATFRYLLPHLTPHFRCHIVDLVGAGESRFGADTRIDLHTHIRSLRRAVDALGLRDFAFVGHDSGGLMGRHAFAGDERLRSMALVNTEQTRGIHWRFRQFLWMAKLPGFERLFGSLVMKRGLRRNRFLLGDCFRDRSRLDGEFEEFFLAPIHTNAARRRAAAQLIRRFDMGLVSSLEEVHRNIRVPVKLIWGEKDPFFPVAWAKEMVSTFPDASLSVVPGAKLFVHEEEPERVAELMLPALLPPRDQSSTTSQERSVASA